MATERQLVDLNDVFPNNMMPVITGDPWLTFKKLVDRLNNAPVIDAVEVVHGLWKECDWVKYDGHSECVRYPKAAWCCSNCRNAFKKELLWKDNYCPNCGAKMDGE